MEDQRRETWRLGCQSLGVFALLIAYHFLLRWLMIHRGLALGAVGPGTTVYRVVPLYAYIKPHLTTGLLLAIVGLASYWVWLRLVARNTQRRERYFLPTLMLWYVGLAALVAMVDGGAGRIWRPYELLTDTDYIGAVPQVTSAREFLRDYVRLIPDLPMHCQTHPPGGVLFLWLVDRAIRPGPVAAALATIMAAAFVVPAVYGLAGEVLDRRSARLAGCLFVLAPSVMLYTATSMDAVFMVPMAWTFWLLWMSRRRSSWLLGAAAGLAAVLASLMTFSAAFLGLWGIALLIVTVLFDREKLSGTAMALVASAASSLAALTLLYFATGYNLLENLNVAIAGHRDIMTGSNYATPQQYAHLVVGNLVAFFASVGVPLAVLVFRQSWSDVRGSQGRPVDPQPGRVLTLSFLLALAVLAVAPLYTLEVERIWIFMVPLVVISATRILASGGLPDRPEPVVRLTFVLLSIQLVVMEAMLNTTW